MDKETLQKPKNKKILTGIIAAAILLLGLIFGVITLAGNTPGRRADKYLDLGNKYLNELDYEQALVAYRQVLEIEPKNLDAYKGGLAAYAGLGDSEGMAEFYSDALGVIEGLTEEELKSVYDTAVEIYLYADTVYPDDHEAAALALERGYDTLGGDERLIRELIEEYGILAEAYIDAGDYEKEQEIYKKIADKDLGNAGALPGGNLNAEPTPEPTPEPVRYVEEISFTYSVEEYEGYGYTYGGSIPLMKDGKWGAVDYENKVIVPFEYDEYMSRPDDQGRFILSKYVESEETDSWSGETYQIETPEYYLFNNQGEIIYQGMVSEGRGTGVYLSGGMYIIVEYIEDHGYRAEYHSMDGSVVASVSGYNTSMPNGFYDGICYVSACGYDYETTNTDIGTVDLQGNVTWRDNPGTAEEWGWRYNVFMLYPISTINHGYYVLGNYGGPMDCPILIVYDERDNKVAEFNFLGLYVDENGKVFYSWEGGGGEYLDLGYYVDGFYFYNYGSEMVFSVEEKNVLIDFARNTQGPEGQLDMDEVVLAVYDRIYMADEKYWLVQSGENWGYIDHEGNEMAMFEEAGEFRNGYAIVKEDGEAWLIDESFQKLQNLGAGDVIRAVGDIYAVHLGDKVHFYHLINQ